MKWEPVAAIILVIGIGLWLALGPNHGPLPRRPDSIAYELRVGDYRGVIERSTGDAQGPHPNEPVFRVLTRKGHVSHEMSSDEFAEIFGPLARRDMLEAAPNSLFALLNITSWSALVWVGIGLLGQAAFSGRFLVQWIQSERAGETKVPESFWWMSLIGGIALFSYFVWRQDPIGVLGQSAGLVIYARNIRLIHKARRRTAGTARAAPVAIMNATE